MSITDDEKRREAQQRLLAEILGQAQAQAQAEKQRLLNAGAQQQTQARPITDPGQRQSARQRTISQTLGPRPQAQSAGMDAQSREFFERERLLNAQNRRGSQAVAPPRADLGAEDRICRKLNAIVRRSDVEVRQIDGAIEIRTRSSMRREVIRAYLSPKTVTSTTARYR